MSEMKRGIMDLPIDVAPELKEAARVQVGRFSYGAEDETELLAMLGLLDEDEPEPQPMKRDEVPFTLTPMQKRFKETRRLPVPPACKHGHEYTPRNTKYRSHGRVTCRTCENEYRRQLRKK